LAADKKYQKQGIGKSLFKIVIQKATKDEVTVNSSPFAVDIYKKLGFECIDHEQLVDGIRFVPMLYRINKKTS